MQHTIGLGAGKVYQALYIKGELSLTKLKSTTELDSFTLNASIGWLAREEKVVFSKKGKNILVDLK